jgi:hypothetical protein
MNERGATTGSFFDRYLEPADRLNEMLFGLIMVLTFTLTAGFAVGEGEDAARELLIATLGCNLAWGVIDGAMYVMGSLMERSRRERAIERVRSAPDEATAFALIARYFENTLARFATDEQRVQFYGVVRAAARRKPPERMRLHREDVYGGVASFCLVVFTTIPAAIPFLLIDAPHRALRVSNLLMVVLLFLVGFQWGRHAYVNRWLAAFAFLATGAALVGIAIALGG